MHIIGGNVGELVYVFKIRKWLYDQIRSFILECLFNRLGYLPGLSEILSHFELIPDAALTLTLTRYCTMRLRKVL